MTTQEFLFVIGPTASAITIIVLTILITTGE